MTSSDRIEINHRISAGRKKKFGKTSETMEGFRFVTPPLTSLSRPNAVKDVVTKCIDFSEA
jgi:hypothetical protein